MKTETENASRWLGRIVLIGLSTGAIGLALLVDAHVAMWINAHSSGALQRFMHIVSRVGDWPGHVLVGLIMIAVAWLSGSKRWTRIFLAVLIACALAGIVARVGKIAIGRPRPSIHVEQTWNGPSLHSKFNAFPSGHTAASTAFFVTLLIAAGWRIGIPLLIVPLLIAASRMIVAAHYLSDVVGGFAVGVIAAFLVADWMRVRSPRSRIELSASGIQETGKS